MLRVVSAYAMGVIVAFILGSIIGTQMVLSSVQSMGLTITWESRLAATGSDLVGLATSLLPLMTLFLVAGWGLVDWYSGRVGRYRHATAFMITGAGCLLILHPLLSLILGVDVFAPARTGLGQLAQGFAGALGGIWFARVRLSVEQHGPEA